jgi:hypothetical protein
MSARRTIRPGRGPANTTTPRPDDARTRKGQRLTFASDEGDVLYMASLIRRLPRRYRDNIQTFVIASCVEAMTDELLSAAERARVPDVSDVAAPQRAEPTRYGEP